MYNSYPLQSIQAIKGFERSLYELLRPLNMDGKYEEISNDILYQLASTNNITILRKRLLEAKKIFSENKNVDLILADIIIDDDYTDYKLKLK